MQIRVIVFGQLTDIFDNTSLTLTDIPDTGTLVQKLNSIYPRLVGVNYMIAVEKQKITGNTILKDGCTVALLPPFSGG